MPKFLLKLLKWSLKLQLVFQQKDPLKYNSFFIQQFKKINEAHAILSDEKKREIYDKYGSFGLKMAEQFGDEFIDTFMAFSSGWFQCAFWTCFCLTGFFCGCCCCCCCFCGCCGKLKKDMEDFDDEVPDLAQFEVSFFHSIFSSLLSGYWSQLTNAGVIFCFYLTTSVWKLIRIVVSVIFWPDFDNIF